MIPEHMRELTDGLLRKRPLYRDREFSSIEDLDEVSLLMDRLEAMAAILPHLNRDLRIQDLAGTNTGAEVDLESIILTSLPVNIMCRETGFRPISRDELLGFLSRATRIKGSRRTVHDAFRKELSGYLTTLEGSLDRGRADDIAGILSMRLEEEISGMRDLSSLDPRFITCVVVKL